MARGEGGARRPATKFPNLQKKLDKHSTQKAEDSKQQRERSLQKRDRGTP